MFLGKLKKQNKILWNWYLTERDLDWPSHKVVCALKWHVKHVPFPDYGYAGSWKSNLEYACDRMNGGRAKAILRLLREAKNADKKNHELSMVDGKKL